MNGSGPPPRLSASFAVLVSLTACASPGSEPRPDELIADTGTADAPYDAVMGPEDVSDADLDPILGDEVEDCRSTLRYCPCGEDVETFAECCGPGPPELGSVVWYCAEPGPRWRMWESTGEACSASEIGECPWQSL